MKHINFLKGIIIAKIGVESMKYQNPKATVDMVILEQNQSVVLVKRANPPYLNCWALPGGFVELGEKVEDAVLRESKEETGLEVEILKLVGVYSDPGRDPRGHTISIVYLCRKKNQGEPLRAGTDAKAAKIYSRTEIEQIQLAFDHKIILHDALKLADQENLW